MNTMKCRAAASQLNRSTTTGAKHTHEGLTCTRGGRPRDMKEKAKEKYASLVTHEAHISQHMHRSGYAGSQMARLRARL